MTKVDRIELDERIKALDYWGRLTCEKMLELRVKTKKELLAELRAK